MLQTFILILDDNIALYDLKNARGKLSSEKLLYNIFQIMQCYIFILYRELQLKLHCKTFHNYNCVYPAIEKIDTLSKCVILDSTGNV